MVSRNSKILLLFPTLPAIPKTTLSSKALIFKEFTYPDEAFTDNGAERKLSSKAPVPHDVSVIDPSMVTAYLVLTLTTCPSVKVLVVNILFVDIPCITTPSTENSNKSAPPDAVKVTGVPKHRGLVVLFGGEAVKVTAEGAT